jgi:hypothetical protein
MSDIYKQKTIYMKNLFNDIETSEKNRILEMHKKRGYNTIIVESPMDSMFYPGDDYTKDMGNSVMDTISTIKEKLESIPMSAFAKLPNPEKIIDNVNKFFGGDVTKMSQSEVEDIISREFESSTIGESKDDSWFNYSAPNYSETRTTKIKDIKGGLKQKILGVLVKVFGINLITFGVIGAAIGQVCGIAAMSPVISMIVSAIAIVIITTVRSIMYFKNRHNEE